MCYVVILTSDKVSGVIENIGVMIFITMMTIIKELISEKSYGSKRELS